MQIAITSKCHLDIFSSSNIKACKSKWQTSKPPLSTFQQQQQLRHAKSKWQTSIVNFSRKNVVFPFGISWRAIHQKHTLHTAHNNSYTFHLPHLGTHIFPDHPWQNTHSPENCLFSCHQKLSCILRTALASQHALKCIFLKNMKLPYQH